ncbi:MAG: SufE family protein [Woeseia sp.]
MTVTNEVRQAEAELIEEFRFFDNWMDRYQYLVDLGRRLPDFPEAWKTEQNRIKGCQAQVWFKAEQYGDRLKFHAVSDAAIVSGLIAVILRIYGGKRAAEILETPPEFVSALQLAQHLSPTRSNGLSSMLAAIRRFAGQAVEVDRA